MTASGRKQAVQRSNQPRCAALSISIEIIQTEERLLFVPLQFFSAGQQANQLLRLMDQQDLAKTNFSIAYMENDDYDPTAFADLSRHLLTRANRLNSYSLPGRHNDDSAGMLQWFLIRYRQILQHDFER